MHFSVVQVLSFHMQSKAAHALMWKFTGQIQSYWYKSKEMLLIELQQKHLDEETGDKCCFQAIIA